MGSNVGSLMALTASDSPVCCKGIGAPSPGGWGSHGGGGGLLNPKFGIDCETWEKERSPPGGGGGTASLRVGTQNKTTDPRFCANHSPLSLSLLFYSPLFLRHQRKAYCYYCCYRGLPPVDIIFSCPDTITLINVAKTLIIANPGCFPWTSQAHNYSPNRKCPSDSPPPESS